MSNPVLTQIQEGFVHHVHESTVKNGANVEQQLSRMAADPQIQGELHRIEKEFSYAEADGLETT